MKKLIPLAVLVSAPMLGSAATLTDSFQVLLNLQSSCTLDSTTDLNFNDQTDADVIAGGIDADNTVTVTCSDGADFTINLSDGANFGNGPVGTERAMKSGNSSYVSYELYSDSGRTTAWTSADNVAFDGTGANQDIPIYGRIPAQTPTIDAADDFNATGLSLSDTVTVTLTY
ncbi:spore coat U domain-containing protein [Alcanivorax sp. DP30]|uniref:Csu type fimbrial protein n=1 Tax=Alcanivorax sp. DP30 TaxID=2606217 RepID=UPI0013704B7F|nr:spore coat U domain-containing protein [Alcanivorax sp. DP30]MZR62335.1 fimbrial major subunit CsuA/B family protein [Alcanivorax sp. DP30]